MRGALRLRLDITSIIAAFKSPYPFCESRLVIREIIAPPLATRVEVLKNVLTYPVPLPQSLREVVFFN